MSVAHLIKPATIGAVSLKNHIIMAPLTRCRATADHVPTPLMAEYYGQRATAGLIIAEATMVSPGASAFGAREPGIYSHAQVEGWKAVTKAVHDKGGKIFLQLWHGGRACHPLLNQGKAAVSASAIAIEDSVYTPIGKVPLEVPHALEDWEIPAIVEDFRRGAKNALAAGFDGVEVHGANGYLLDQFLRDGSNKRTKGLYAGAVDKRARLLLDVVDTVVAEVGADRVGARFSLLNSYNSMADSRPEFVQEYVAAALAERGIAYIHIMRGDFYGAQKGDLLAATRRGIERGAQPGKPKPKIIGNMGYTPAEAEEQVALGSANGGIDLICFGHHYVSNPNLVEKVTKGEALVEPDPSTFYTNEAKGYTDY
jgi:N-ethylmaleimide reductase